MDFQGVDLLHWDKFLAELIFILHIRYSLHQHALLQRARFGSGNFGSSLSYVRTHHCRSVEWPRNRIARPASAWEGVLEIFLYRVCLRFEQKFCLLYILFAQNLSK